MAKIKPFKGVRPPKEFIEEVASRPYDVLNSQEARAEAEGNEKSLYHIIKPEIDFPEGTDEHDPAVYLKAAANFNNFQEKGWLVQDQKECYYVYAQTMNGKTQYGLVVGAYVPDYMNGTIKKHELTRRDKEEDRMKHVRVNNANIEPVFFAYPDNSELDAIVMKYTAREPEYNFVAKLDGFGHTFWIIDEDKDIARITELFGEMPALIEADGVKAVASTADLFKACQIVSLHIPATAETKGSINFELMNSMPKGAIVVNTARKEVMDEAGLAKMLEERPDFKYLTDIMPAIHAELAEKYAGRYFSTPKKMGAQTAEANINAGIAAAKQIVDFLVNGNEKYRVNK